MAPIEQGVSEFSDEEIYLMAKSKREDSVLISRSGHRCESSLRAAQEAVPARKELKKKRSWFKRGSPSKDSSKQDFSNASNDKMGNSGSFNRSVTVNVYGGNNTFDNTRGKMRFRSSSSKGIGRGKEKSMPAQLVEAGFTGATKGPVKAFVPY